MEDFATVQPLTETYNKSFEHNADRMLNSIIQQFTTAENAFREIGFILEELDRHLSSNNSKAGVDRRIESEITKLYRNIKDVRGKVAMSVGKSINQAIK